jgi:hypothetical protein
MAPFRAVAGPREGGWPADWGLLRALAAAQPETTAAGRRTKSSALRRCRSPARRLASQHDSGKLADTARLFFSKEKLYASTFPLVLCLHFFKYSTYYRTVYYTISILLYKVKAGEKVPQHTSKAQQVSRPDIILGLILSLIFGHTSAFRPVRFRVLGPNKIRSRILFYIYFVVIFEK